MNNFLLDTNLIYSFGNVASPTNLKPLLTIKKNLKNKTIGISEWSLIEILCTDKSSKLKIDLINWIIKEDITIIPAFSEYNFASLLSDFYKENNIIMRRIPYNQFSGYKLKKQNDDQITISTQLQSLIVEEKIKCERDYYYSFLLIAQTYLGCLLENGMRNGSGKYRRTPIEKICVFSNVLAVKSVIEMKTKKMSIEAILKDFYSGSIDKDELNKRITIQYYEYTLFVVDIFNEVITGNAKNKYPIECREVENKFIEKHKSFESEHLNWKNHYPIPTNKIKNYISRKNNDANILSGVIQLKPTSEFEKKLKQRCLDELRQKGIGIIEYYFEFISIFYKYGKFPECKNQTQCLVDKNNLFDALILSNYPDFIVLSSDIVFGAIINRIDPKHYLENKKLVLI